MKTEKNRKILQNTRNRVFLPRKIIFISLLLPFHLAGRYSLTLIKNRINLTVKLKAVLNFAEHLHGSAKPQHAFARPQYAFAELLFYIVKPSIHFVEPLHGSAKPAFHFEKP